MTIQELLAQPRVKLANLPTPVTPVNYRWGDVRLFLKRDDLTGCGLMGNKVRKLEYLIADAKAQGCDTLVTCGGVHSNYARATAVAAAMTGMHCVVVLAGESPKELDGNLLLIRMVGADARIIPPMDSRDRAARMQEIAETLKSDGRKPYVMPSGGSNEVGALGYIRTMHEIAEQLGRDPRGIGCIVHACGSGGTYVGSFLGCRLAGVQPRLVAAIVERTIDDWKGELSDYLARTVRRWKLDVTFDTADIELIAGTGRGYALNTDEEIDFIASFARQTGIFLDPVYTGKALYALDRDIRNGSFDPGGHVMFIHTGGVFDLFPNREQFAAAIARRKTNVQDAPREPR